jgi:hypothetical protein
MPKKKSSLKFGNTKELVDRCLTLRYFHPEDDEPAAIPYVWVPGEGNLVVVTGENAGGKSFFRRCAASVARQEENKKMEVISISMEGRRQVAYNIGLVFVYGDEEHDATGVNSIRTVVTAISTCQSREADHVVIWDEPDLGLSEGNAASVGSALADFSLALPEHTKGAVVITHRKALVKELLRAKPHYLYLGSEDAPESLQAWVDAPPVVKPLNKVLKDAHKRFLAISTILKDVRGE